ncbi:MAG: hypothetical protein ACC660_03055 [Acidimicrobiales bacterium]
MPVSSGPQLNLTRTLAFAVLSLAVGIGLLFLIVQLAGSGDVQFKLGDDVFEVGNAERFAERIDDDFAPVLFSSLSRSRPIYVQHVGTDPTIGWYAIDARSPSDLDGCVTGLLWDQQLSLFVDSCEPASTFSPDGLGLLQYDIDVNAAGTLIVDLNQDEGQ